MEVHMFIILHYYRNTISLVPSNVPVALQIKNYKTYVKREIQNQSLLRHPLIVSIREVCHNSIDCTIIICNHI